MRRIITGRGPDGRSRIESIEAVGNEIAEVLHHFTGGADLATPRGDADILDLGTGVGEARLVAVSYPPNFESPFHRTHSVDYDYVISGEATLLLDSGPFDLGPGDLVIMNAVDHGWRTGSMGAELLVIVLGIEPDTDRPATAAFD